MSEPGPNRNGLLRSVRRHAERRRRAEKDPDLSVGRQLSQIGVLGWMLVTPALLLLLAGRWLDRHFGNGIFWSAQALVLGIALGCWSAWRWIRRS